MPTGTATYHATDGTAYQRFLGRWTARLAREFLAFADLPHDGPRSMTATAWAVRGTILG